MVVDQIVGAGGCGAGEVGRGLAVLDPSRGAWVLGTEGRSHRVDALLEVTGLVPDKDHVVVSQVGDDVAV